MVLAEGRGYRARYLTGVLVQSCLESVLARFVFAQLGAWLVCECRTVL